MGGGEMPYKVPDWKIYQVGNHTPELQQVQRMLSSLGLKVSQDTERGDVEAMMSVRTPGSATRSGGLTDGCRTWRTDPCW